MWIYIYVYVYTYMHVYIIYSVQRLRRAKTIGAWWTKEFTSKISLVNLHQHLSVGEELCVWDFKRLLNSFSKSTTIFVPSTWKNSTPKEFLAHRFHKDSWFVHRCSGREQSIFQWFVVIQNYVILRKIKVIPEPCLIRLSERCSFPC